ERLLCEDRRSQTQRDRDAVRRARVDVEHVLAAIEVQLGVVRVLLHLRDLHPLERRAHADDQPLAQVVCEWPRRLDLLHFHHDRLGLRLPDPDGQEPLAFFLLENHHVRIRHAVQPEPGHFDFDHECLPGGRHVPMSHDARYFFCSSVSTSIFAPSAASLRRAISRSMLSGTRCTSRDRLAPFSTRYSAASDWFAKLMSMTLAGWPSAAARLIKRPSPSRKTWLPRTTYSWTNCRTSRDLPPESFSSAGMSTSTLKWPELQTTAPSFIAVKCSALMTLVLPVSVQKMSPIGAASAIVITRKPSMVASSALSGSISVTMTLAPCPRARMATPRPHQP